MLPQYQVNQRRKAPIALVTDSIADIPASTSAASSNRFTNEYLNGRY